MTRSQLITEIPKLALFASITDSLDWLATRLCDLTREVSAQHVPGTFKTFLYNANQFANLQFFMFKIDIFNSYLINNYNILIVTCIL